MAIDKYHAAHIRGVHVGFCLSQENLDPLEITKCLNIQADASAKKGDIIINPFNAKAPPGYHREGQFSIFSEGKVFSKDINDHFIYLLKILLPVSEQILEFVKDGYETFFDVHWESTYLYAGTGPLIDKRCMMGVGLLQAGMGFDIYQINEA